MLDAVLHWLYSMPLSAAIRENTVAFPWIETVHVLAIVTVVGTITIVDLRLVGLPAHKRGVRALMLELLPVTWGAFSLALVAGALLFMSNAEKYAHSGPFQLKMLLLALAGANMTVFHLITQRTLPAWDELASTPIGAKLAGLCSLILWIGIVCLGRWVGFTLY